MMRLASACALLCPILDVHGAALQPKTAFQLKTEGDNLLNKQNPFEIVTRNELENAPIFTEIFEKSSTPKK